MQKAFVISILAFILILSHSGFAFVSFANSLPAAQLINVPLKDNISDFNREAYEFVYRFLTKRMVEGIERGTLPLSRGEINNILLELKKKQENGAIHLSEVDKERLEALLAYFSDELQQATEKNEGLKKRRHVLSLKGEQNLFSVDLSLLQESRTRKGLSFSQKGTQYTTSILPSVYGQVRHDFAFSSTMAYRFLTGDFFADTFVDESRYSQYGRLANSLQNTANIDAYLLFKLPWFSMQIGKDNMRWGPGYHGTLLISEHPISWDMIKLTASYKPIKFSSFTAILGTNIGTNSGGTDKKYLSGHRIEGFLWNRIGLGLSEVVVYGDRFVPNYLNPITIYLIEADRIVVYSPYNDNELISGDIRISLSNIELYGELMVDDYNVGEGFHAWDTKFGILGGIHLTDPFGFPDTDVFMEYVFINQYAYTNESPINIYRHYTSVIGHHIDSDADDFWAQLKHRFTDKLETTLTYELERHGEGDITKGIPPTETGSTWAPLSGITQSEHSISVGLSYTHIGRYRLGMEYRNNWLKNLGNRRGKRASGQEITIEGAYRF